LILLSAAKVSIYAQKTKKKDKNVGADAIFSLFIFHFSLFFVPLQPLFASCDGGLSKTT
jgi:hypothetical protein